MWYGPSERPSTRSQPLSSPGRLPMTRRYQQNQMPHAQWRFDTLMRRAVGQRHIRDRVMDLVEAFSIWTGHTSATCDTPADLPSTTGSATLTSDNSANPAKERAQSIGLARIWVEVKVGVAAARFEAASRRMVASSKGSKGINGWTRASEGGTGSRGVVREKKCMPWRLTPARLTERTPVVVCQRFSSRVEKNAVASTAGRRKSSILKFSGSNNWLAFIEWPVTNFSLSVPLCDAISDGVVLDLNSSARNGIGFGASSSSRDSAGTALPDRRRAVRTCVCHSSKHLTHAPLQPVKCLWRNACCIHASVFQDDPCPEVDALCCRGGGYSHICPCPMSV